MQVDDVKQIIEQALPGATALVGDMTGTGDHLEAVVIAAQFEGMSRVQQHKAVYRALGELVDGRTIHALALQTFTPAQWEARSPAFGKESAR
ncbi:MAG: hypothetical protein AMXMBFR64_46970 [Myxococcales bacterium]